MEERVELKCIKCDCGFTLNKRYVKYAELGYKNCQKDLCKKCHTEAKSLRIKENNYLYLKCDECGKNILRAKNNVRTTNFCDKNCALPYLVKQNNLNRININEKISNTNKGKNYKNLNNELTPNNCIVCNKVIRIGKQYCSRKCQNTLFRTDEYRTKMSNALKGKTGGLRDGGGYTKMFEYTNKLNQIMKLNTSEIEVAKIMDNLNLTWNRNNIGFKYIDLNGKNRKYYPDFYVKEYDTYVEFKGFVTEYMTHKMETAVLNNNFKLLIIYSNDKRYKNLGLNIGDLQANNNLLVKKLNGTFA